MDRRLIHYSEKPLDKIYSEDHDSSRCGTYKTPGFWFSCEGDQDWVEWCRDNDWGDYCYAYEVFLKEDSGVLHLKDAEAIDRFSRAYGQGWGELNWLLVRADYKGLMVSPYCWERRLDNDTTWYYGWDCASGVIWDASVVERFVEIPVPDFDAEKTEITVDTEG